MWSSPAPPLEIYLLGLVDFTEVQQLQRRMVFDLGECGGARLILCEHAPTISVGRTGSRMHIRECDHTLRSMGIGVHWVNRGGGCVLHVPGQLAIYLMLNLGAADLMLTQYLDRLHQVILGVLGDFELEGRLLNDQSGVFLGHARVATVGVAVNRWIAYHGMTLNVGPCLDLFDILEEPGVVPCRLRQTSMESRRQRHTAMPKVRESMIRHVERVFALGRHHLYTQHPLIRRKVLTHVYAPSPG